MGGRGWIDPPPPPSIWGGEGTPNSFSYRSGDDTGLWGGRFEAGGRSDEKAQPGVLGGGGRGQRRGGLLAEAGGGEELGVWGGGGSYLQVGEGSRLFFKGGQA